MHCGGNQQPAQRLVYPTGQSHIGMGEQAGQIERQRKAHGGSRACSQQQHNSRFIERRPCGLEGVKAQATAGIEHGVQVVNAVQPPEPGQPVQ